MAKNAMPKSKAKTAYGLLSEIRKLIVDEPKRYDHMFDLLRDDSIRADERPACGTVGCVAGWCCVLKVSRDIHPFSVPLKARDILGLSGDQFYELYAWDAVKARHTVGITKHAALGAAHIAKFQKKYAAQLKAKRV